MAAAEADSRNILSWTAEQFGKAQARAFAKTLSSALRALTAGPTLIGVSAYAPMITLARPRSVAA